MINFPSNPSVNDQYEFQGKVWRWTGAVWSIVSAGDDGTSYELVNGGAQFVLNANGTVTFNDGSIQQTAYTGNANGEYTLPTATTSTLGGVKIDGTSITIANGVISAGASDLSTYQTTAGLSANVAKLASNNSLFLGGIAANQYAYANQIASVGATYVQNTDSRTLSGNLTFSGANLTITKDLTIIGTDFDKGLMITGDRGNIYLGSNTRDARTVLSLNSLSGYFSGVQVNRANAELWFAGASNTEGYVIRRSGTTNDVSISNTTGMVTIGSLTVGNTIIGTTNNSLYLDGVAANQYAYANAIPSLSGYQTTAGLSANVATLTSNNATNLGGTAASGYAKLNANAAFANVAADGSVTANSSTAFIVGDAAISGVALQMPREGAIRNLYNGSTNMYFDVSIGGTTHGQFQFRSSNTFNNVLTMSPTAFNVNTDAVVTARTASFGRLPWNSAIDSELTVDDYRFRINNNAGNVYAQIISNVSGQTKNSAWTAVAAISGQAIGQGGSTGTLVPNNAWTNLYTFASMNSAGDTITATLQDKALGRIYRVTFMRSDNGTTAGYNIIAERLL